MDDAGVASPELPEWLPDGWFMKTVSCKDGSVDRVIPSFSSGGSIRNLSPSSYSLCFVVLDADQQGAVATPTGISRHFIFAPFAVSSPNRKYEEI